MQRERVQELIEQINQASSGAGRPIQLMEVCGTHTVNLFRSGVKSLLPAQIRLISGPGCPVCVTSQGYIDTACALATRSDVTICTYGDMVRVPGGNSSLEHRRSQGARVRVVYSARDAVAHAQANPDQKVVFLAVGFETTTPATAVAVKEAEAKKLDNFFVLSGHKLVIPAMATLLSAGEVVLDGFLCPGHVSIIIGAQAYEPIATEFHKPCVIAGFEPEQLFRGILHLVRQVNDGHSKVENVYSVAVTEPGNTQAQALIEDVFETTPVVWRAMGTIDRSGLQLKGKYQKYDALTHFKMEWGPDVEPPGCRCGDVIQGKLEPNKCGLFGNTCTPQYPIGPCMVSSEGTCAAWYKYGGYSHRVSDVTDPI